MIKRGKGNRREKTSMTYTSIIGTFASDFTEDSIVSAFLDLAELGGNWL